MLLIWIDWSLFAVPITFNHLIREYNFIIVKYEGLVVLC
jgi:hypothetical protein